MNKGVEPTVSVIMVFMQVWYASWGKLKCAQVQTRHHKDNIWLSLPTRKSNAKNPESSYYSFVNYIYRSIQLTRATQLPNSIMATVLLSVLIAGWFVTSLLNSKQLCTIQVLLIIGSTNIYVVINLIIFVFRCVLSKRKFCYTLMYQYIR